jgi:hypothetical protein
MNRNTSFLLLPSRPRPTAPKLGSRGFCFDQRFRPGIARRPGSKASQRRLALLNEVSWYGNNFHASAVPSQTVSPELMQFGYFPL